MNNQALIQSEQQIPIFMGMTRSLVDWFYKLKQARAKHNNLTVFPGLTHWRPIFFIDALNAVIICSSRMASLSHRRCFRFFEKNFLRIFFNHAFGVTEPKEAPYVTTGNNLKLQTLIILKLKN